MGTILSLISSALGAISALLGFKRDQTLKEAGIDAQKAADLTAQASTLKAELDAANNASPAEQALKDGKF